jgi:hypothetical protein
MGKLKDIVLGGKFKPRAGGAYVRVEGMAERYIADAASRVKLRARSKSSPPAATARPAPSRPKHCAAWALR